MNRLGIFLFYDEDGVVDKYIEYLLDDITPLFERFVIVCNGILSHGGRHSLEQYTKEIFVRENKGFDFCAWRDVMFDYIGFNRIKEFDQLILFNDSFFGPFTSFAAIFDEMDSKKLDFWGLSVHGEVETVKKMCPYGYRPRYLQTYFLAINKRMLSDSAFYYYWNRLPVYNNFLEVSEKISAVFTKYFEDLGFSWGVYSDTTDLEQSRETNICQHAFNIYCLVSERRYPILKRKTFVLGQGRFTQYNNGMDLKKTIEYIEKNRYYDMQLIYQHIARRYCLPEIKESLVMEYMTDRNLKVIVDESKAVIIAFLFYEYNLVHLMNMLKKCVSTTYMINIHVPANAVKDIILSEIDLNDNIYIYIDGKFTIENYLNILKEECNKCGDDVSNICVWHDWKINDDIAITNHNSQMELVTDSMLGNNQIINQCINILNENAHIGVLVPSRAWFGTYFQKGNSDNRELIETIYNWENLLDIKFSIPKTKIVMGEQGVFWIKKDILKYLCEKINADKDITVDYVNMSEDSLYVLDILMPYVGQVKGYLTASCIEKDYLLVKSTAIQSFSEAAVKTFGSIGVQSDKSFIKLLTILKQSFNSITEEKAARSIKEENSKVQIITKEVEVPVLVEIGLKRALQNYIRKIFHKNKIGDDLR